jgi:hypothetical protein
MKFAVLYRHLTYYDKIFALEIRAMVASYALNRTPLTIKDRSTVGTIPIKIQITLWFLKTRKKKENNKIQTQHTREGGKKLKTQRE